MRNVTTYRICAAACIAMIPVGGLRDETLTVILAGAGALYCLRWARIEREREEARREYERIVGEIRTQFQEFGFALGEALTPTVRTAVEAFRSVGEALSHVRLVPPPDDPVVPPK